MPNEDISYEGFVRFLMEIDPVATLNSLGYSDEEIDEILSNAVYDPNYSH